MHKNDKKIRALLDLVESKKETLGEKPKGNWKTNCVWNLEKNFVNINTIPDVETCVVLLANLISKESYRLSAFDLLEIEPFDTKYCGFLYDDWAHDFKLRASMIKWEEKNRELKKLEEKLNSMKSDDAKTEDTLEDIKKLLS